MSKKTIVLLLCFLSLNICASGTGYTFCVSHPDYPAFKAEVNCNTDEINRSTARQLIISKFKPVMGDDISVTIFEATVCSCKNDCPVYEMKVNAGASSKSAIETAQDTWDMTVDEVKNAIENPGVLAKKLLKGAGKLFGDLWD